MTIIFGAQGVYSSLRGQPSQIFTLQPGQARLVPAGTWNVGLDLYSTVQEWDTVQDMWVNQGGGSLDSAYRYLNSDGNNYRIVNLLGTIVGAVITTAGSGYSSATPPTVTASAGNPVLQAIVGGAVSTSVTVTNGGTNYTLPPLVYLDAPPQNGVGGYQATGYSTLTGSAVSSITIDNQGAGYVGVPNIYIVNDPRDTTGSGASAVATLTGAGTITGIAVLNNGTSQTSVPTLSFSSGSAAATAIPLLSVGAYTVTTAGAGYSGGVEISALGTGINATSVLTNPRYTTNLVKTRKASIIGALSSGALTATGQVLMDGGIYGGTTVTPILYATGVVTTAAVPAITWANKNSNVTLYPV